MHDIFKLSSTNLNFGAICDISWYHRFSKRWFSANYLNVPQEWPNLRYGIRYLRLTQFIRIEDITPFYVVEIFDFWCEKRAQNEAETGSHANQYFILRMLQIMHVVLTWKMLKLHTIYGNQLGNRAWIDTEQHLTYTQPYQKRMTILLTFKLTFL